MTADRKIRSPRPLATVLAFDARIDCDPVTRAQPGIHVLSLEGRLEPIGMNGTHRTHQCLLVVSSMLAGAADVLERAAGCVRPPDAQTMRFDQTDALVRLGAVLSDVRVDYLTVIVVAEPGASGMQFARGLLPLLAQCPRETRVLKIVVAEHPAMSAIAGDFDGYVRSERGNALADATCLALVCGGLRGGFAWADPDDLAPLLGSPAAPASVIEALWCIEARRIEFGSAEDAQRVRLASEKAAFLVVDGYPLKLRETGEVITSLSPVQAFCPDLSFVRGVPVPPGALLLVIVASALPARHAVCQAVDAA